MAETRRDFLKKTAVLGLGSFGLLSPMGKTLQNLHFLPAGFKPRKKNILFIAVDDLRPELGCYGHPIVLSPNIDALAARGTLFEKNYCQQAVCAPSRASLLTGKRPDTTRIWDLKTHIRATMPDVVTLQQHFMNNGYFSQGMGKLFHSGHEDAASYTVPHRYPKAPTYALPENVEQLTKTGKKREAEKDLTGAEAKMRGPAYECADVPDNTYEDGKLAELAIEALGKLAQKAKSKNKDEFQPFFLGLGFRKPHLPFVAPKKYYDLYNRENIPLPYPNRPNNAPDIAFTNWNELRSYSDIPDVGNLDAEQTRALIHAYYACVSYTDAQVGKVLEELDRLGLRDDTIIVLWGDHGWKLGEYSSWSKHTNFELDTRAPLIISDPDLPKGIRVRRLTEFVDVFPTLTSLCGLKNPDGLEGSELTPLFTDPNQNWKKAAFSQYPRPKKVMGYSIRTERYRYTEWINQKTGEARDRELYDLQNDPLCKENIVSGENNAKLVEHLKGMLKAGWQAARP